MSILRSFKLVCRFSTLVILLAGCETNHPTVSTWNESQLTPGKADKISLIPQLNPSTQTAELGRLLVAELKREGFDIVPVEQADYLMAYTLDDELVPQSRSIAITQQAPPSQTTGQVIDQPPVSAVSEPVLFRSRGIRFYLYNNPKTHPGGFKIVWQGYIAAGQTTSTERETALIKTLLGYLGQEHHGNVTLAQ